MKQSTIRLALLAIAFTVVTAFTGFNKKEKREAAKDGPYYWYTSGGAYRENHYHSIALEALETGAETSNCGGCAIAYKGFLSSSVTWMMGIPIPNDWNSPDAVLYAHL